MAGIEDVTDEQHDWLTSFLNIPTRESKPASAQSQPAPYQITGSPDDAKGTDQGLPVPEPEGQASPAPAFVPKDKPPSASMAASQLSHLAEEPSEAHKAWKHLSNEDKSTLIAKMTARYDAKFAAKFKEMADSGKPVPNDAYWGPGVTTPERLKALGWRKKGQLITGNAGVVLELWVHPSGANGQRDISPHPADGDKGNSGGSAGQDDETDDSSDDICDDIKKKLDEITERLDKAMANFEDLVARLEALSPGADRTELDAECEERRRDVRNIIDEISELEDEANDLDQSCGDLVSDEWMNATEEYTSLRERFDRVK